MPVKPPSPDMTTRSGLPVYFDRPDLVTINPLDIKTGLTNLCRYHGQFEYSVLSHSLLVAEILGVSGRLARLGALHDFHEAYVGDQNPREKTDAFRRREDAWSAKIHAHFGVPVATNHEHRFVKFADRMALISEMVIIGHPAAEYDEEYWRPHGGKPKPTQRSLTLAQVYRNTDSDTLWSALMSILGGSNDMLRRPGAQWQGVAWR